MAMTLGDEGTEDQKAHKKDRKVHSSGAEAEGRAEHGEARRHSQPSCSKQQPESCP